MSSRQQIASFRKINAGILASAQLAAQDDRPSVAKRDVSLVLKRVAPALGIDGTAYHILDILLGLVQGDDFQPGRRPVVAISNHRLAEYTRRTPRTVTRCLKKLVEVGILAYRDSPTGRRYVYRGKSGQPDQAYGLDFSPSCFNLEAFKAQADDFQRRIKAEQEAKRAVTRFSRAIVDLVAIAGADFEVFSTKAVAIASNDVLKNGEKASQLERLYREAAHQFEQGGESETQRNRMSCAGDIHDTPLFITSHPDSQKSNELRTCSNEQDIKIQSDTGSAGEMALEREPCGGDPLQQATNAQEAGRQGRHISQQTNLDGVSIGLIRSACTTIQEETGFQITTWPALCEAADQLRVLIGLSQTAYAEAIQRQGRYLAAACIAVVAEKALRDPEQISSPGGYFRAMIDRAGEGKLHLNKSLHGLV